MFVCFLGSGHFLCQCNKESGKVKYSSSSQNLNLASSHSPSQTQCLRFNGMTSYRVTTFPALPSESSACLYPYCLKHPSFQSFPLHHLS